MTENRNDDRGQVGVGTLIVFIAMVLVAAIASGVLINAAGLLQTQSAQASQESSEQVSNRMQVVNSLGTDIDGTNETVGAINLTVSMSPSADEVDLSQATVQWTGPTGTYSLTHDTLTDGDGDFSVTQAKDDDDSSPVLNTRDDRLKMNFDVDSFATSDLDAGSTVELRITTRAGATTIVELIIPQSVAGESAVRV
jgi:flagellin-like protein